MKKQDVQKKQFRQLSDEELKQVTGGRPKNISVNIIGTFSDAILFSMRTCPDSMKDEKGNCPQ